MARIAIRLLMIGVLVSAGFAIWYFPVARAEPVNPARRAAADSDHKNSVAKPVNSSLPRSEGKSAGEVRDDSGPKMTLVWCPPGTFTMGSPESEEHRVKDEKQVRVTLTTGFWLGKYEVKQAEWEGVNGTEWKKKRVFADGGALGGHRQGTDYPASFVSWDEAATFCQRLTEQERQAGRLPNGWEYTLPTESQWEYACRAGSTTRYSFGDDEAQLSDYAWWFGLVFDGSAGKEWFDGTTKAEPWFPRRARTNMPNPVGQQDIHRGEMFPHRVGTKLPNPWGLCDMHGNVCEWCRDSYQPKLPGGDAPVVVKDGYRVCRGGAYRFDVSFCRSANRFKHPPDWQDDVCGFRVALSPVR